MQPHYDDMQMARILPFPLKIILFLCHHPLENFPDDEYFLNRYRRQVPFTCPPTSHLTEYGFFSLFLACISRNNRQPKQKEKTS